MLESLKSINGVVLRPFWPGAGGGGGGEKIMLLVCHSLVNYWDRGVCLLVWMAREWPLC